jgi:TPR repeat protein
MNKPVAIDKIGNDVELHALPRTHEGVARELPEVYYKNGEGSVDRVDRKKLDTWFREARKGTPQAQYNLGVVYFKGVGVPTDHAEAFKWFAKAAEKGSAPGQGFLGVMYENGLGVDQNDEMSLHWYQKAAEQEDGTAQFNRARMYHQGKGTDKAPGEAV